MAIKTNLLIVSGGQTGADRAALDWAISHHIPHAGFCPRGRRAEDGRIDMRYNLTETQSSDYEERTLLNIRHTDLTLIMTDLNTLTPGSRRTYQQARSYDKTVRVVMPGCNLEEISAMLRTTRYRRINIAGPRASKSPTVYDYTQECMEYLWPAFEYVYSTPLGYA